MQQLKIKIYDTITGLQKDRNQILRQNSLRSAYE